MSDICRKGSINITMSSCTLISSVQKFSSLLSSARFLMYPKFIFLSQILIGWKTSFSSAHACIFGRTVGFGLSVPFRYVGWSEFHSWKAKLAIGSCRIFKWVYPSQLLAKRVHLDQILICFPISRLYQFSSLPSRKTQLKTVWIYPTIHT